MKPWGGWAESGTVVDAYAFVLSAANHSSVAWSSFACLQVTVV